MGKIWNVIHGLKPAMMMVIVQIALAGVSVFYKLVSNDGMSMRVMVAYRFLFAAAFVVPLALYVERKSRPKLTRIVLCQAFVCALFGGSMAQNLYAESLVLTSATFASATTNLVPAITFIMAVFFRLEKVGLGTKTGKAKVVGTLMGIGGAMLLTFYKGVEINIWPTKFNLLHHGQHGGGHAASSHREPTDHIVGPLLAIASCFSIALGLMFQAKLSKRYPCHYSSTALIAVMGSLQGVIFALCMERDWSQWRLGWDIRLFTVAYTGTVASGLTVIVIMWCVRMRGPLFVSVFNPLILILVAIAGSLLLNEKLHLGSVLGAVIIICGLYMVLWGKGKEIRRIAQLMPSRSSKEEPEQIQISARSSVESASIFAPTFFTMVDNDTTVNNTVSDQGLPVSHESRLEEGKEGET
ncbi:hypothetical protein RJ639_013856, partial [Escallonia herrerae]